MWLYRIQVPVEHSCDETHASTPRKTILRFDSQQSMSKYVTARVVRSQTSVWRASAAVTPRDISSLMIKSARTPIVRSSPRCSAGSGSEPQRRQYEYPLVRPPDHRRFP